MTRPPQQEGPTVITVLLCLLWLTEERAAAPTPTPESVQFFESRVRPVLIEHCQTCHGEKKQWAGLRLDSRESLLKGGDSGPAIVVAQPDDSLLIRAVRHEDANLKMPEKGKLTDAQIADLVRWVEIGAPFPDAPANSSRKRDPNHWSYQPPVNPAVPVVESNGWSHSAIDQFLLAEIVSDGMAPAETADKRTLIRRVTFDLIGLPATPEEVTDFLSDERPDAFARIVDRLLASPAYGERWGRHWLDVARYADSNGLDENIAHGNAWRYRDYVVTSFNRDKPFDRFIVEQLAGDLLPWSDEQTRHEQLIATGFISVGPKVLAEVNEVKMKMDIIDEQIDTVGRVFLGATLGCARCHDHKFDPIGISDYYGLAGIFKSTRTMETYTKVAKWHEHVLPSRESQELQDRFDEQLAMRKKAVESLVALADQAVLNSLGTYAKPPESLETLYHETTKAELSKLREELATTEKTKPDLPSAMGVAEDQVIDVAIHLRGDPFKLGDVVPRHTPSVIKGAVAPQFSAAESGRKQLSDWLIDPAHPLTARVLVNRIWRNHFGKGLVRTTENFGSLGEPPSHPELLDWLARRLISGGWSQKRLQRAILDSHAYQQSDRVPDKMIEQDPENRRFGRAQVRRLEAEEVRDALLTVCGQLDQAMGGSLLKVKNRGYLFDHTSIDLTDYASQRRSLYLPVIRNNIYDLFQLLDFPDPAVTSGDRTTTTVAPQALMMLNSDFVMQCADHLARQLLGQFMDDDQRISRMYRVAYGRDASDQEHLSSRVFLAEVNHSLAASIPDVADRAAQAWSILCHVMLASNEFIYVR